MGGPNAYEGRVEVCINQVWGTICSNLWGDTDAKVVCNQLGHSKTCKQYLHDVCTYIVMHLHSKRLANLLLVILVSFVDSKAVAYAFYGQGTGPISMTKVACTGNESAVTNCKYSTYLSGCTHAGDAGVQCVPLSGHSLHRQSNSY